MQVFNLRICFLAGTLGQGGAEQQLFYMARALKQMGADVRVYCPYRGEYFEPILEAENIPVIWLGRYGTPVRFIRLASSLARFRPQVIQSSHFHMNVPASILGRLFGSLHFAASRSDLTREVQVYKPWGSWGIRVASVLLTNSHCSRRAAIQLGLSPAKIIVIPNVIDFARFDEARSGQAMPVSRDRGMQAVAIGTLCENKGFDRFLRALAWVRRNGFNVTGWIIGDGPVRAELHALAASLELGESVQFLGRRDDVPALMKRCDVLVSSSKVEGCPNVLLEAMAARLPVITTPAGDAGRLVQTAQAGFVVRHEDVKGMAGGLCRLSKDKRLRCQLGNNGRRYVERYHNERGLGEALLAAYCLVAERQHARRPFHFGASAAGPN